MNNIKHFIYSHYTIIFITLLGCVLFIYNLGKESFWFDEALSYYRATHLETLARSTNMWLYYFLLRLWTTFGDSDYYIRFLSVIFSIVSIPGIYWLGKIVANYRVGLLSAMLLISNTYFITYSQEARAYSMFVCFTIYSSIFFLKAVKENTKKNWILYMLLTICLIHSHVFSAFILFVQAILTVRLYRKKVILNKYYIYSVIGILLLSTPFLYFIYLSIQWRTETMYIIPSPTFSDIIYIVKLLTYNNSSVFMTSFFISTFGFYTVLKKIIKQKVLNFEYFYIISTVVISLIAIFVISSTIKSVFVPRYLIFLVPFFILLLAYGINKIPNLFLKYIMVTILCLANSHQFIVYHSTIRKDNWREAVNILAKNVEKTDTIFISPPFLQTAFHHYSRRQKHIVSKKNLIAGVDYSLDDGYTDALTDMEKNATTELAKKSHRIWLLSAHDDVMKGRIDQRIQTQAIFEQYFDLQKEYKLGQSLKLYLYE